MKTLYVFDLDGTLVDSRQDIVSSVNATLRRFDYPEKPAPVIASYVGHGAPQLIRRAFGEAAPDDVVARGFEFFVEHYGAHMLDETRPYPGVEEGLAAIAGEGQPMAVLSNKPGALSVAMIDGLGWSRYFFRVYGADSLDERKPHPLGIQLLMEEAGVGPATTVMVGDSAVDVQTARNAGVTACGVSYGLQPESFASWPPDFVVDTLTALPSALSEWRRTARVSPSGHSMPM